MIAAYTVRIERELLEYGETCVDLDEVREAVYRGCLDTSAEYRARCVARARQRIYLAARRAGIDVATTVVHDSEGVYVAGRVRERRRA